MISRPADTHHMRLPNITTIIKPWDILQYKDLLLDVPYTRQLQWNGCENGCNKGLTMFATTLL